MRELTPAGTLNKLTGQSLPVRELTPAGMFKKLTGAPRGYCQSRVMTHTTLTTPRLASLATGI